MRNRVFDSAGWREVVVYRLENRKTIVSVPAPSRGTI